MKIATKIVAPAVVAAATLGSWNMGDACTRVVYHGTDSLFIVARSLDWKTPIPTNLYVYPRGIKKQSSNLDNCKRWTSKYGAVYAVGYDGGITEGMNEKGLVINGLFCKTAVYEKEAVSKDDPRPYMSLAVFVAWLLDNNATVDEVIEQLKPQDFRIQGATFDGGTVSTLHWGVTDATGRSIIFEFVDGKLTIHEMGDYRAMTNDPEWPSMRAIMDYWEKIGGQHMLPGTVTSPDRCVRANYYAHHVEAVGEQSMGVSIARSVLMNSCVPYTYLIEDEPNLSSTQWRSYSDTRDLCYYFDIVTNPGYYYIDLNRIGLTRKQIYKLDTARHTEVVGCVNHLLEKSQGFNPMY